ncbi:N-acetylglucosamine kinase [Streptomyces sp. NPDC000880]
MSRLTGDSTALVVLAVDGGQTGLRARAVVDGRIATSSADGFTYAKGDAVETVITLVEQAWLNLPQWARSASGSVAVGLTSEPGSTETVERLAQAIAALTAADRVRIAHDSVTAHLGALGGRPGVVVAAGTGAVALGVAPDGSASRVDGWGYVLGDRGSGFSVGRSGLRAACAARDGRGAATLLAALAERRYGPLADLPLRLYRSPTLVADVAGFSVEVAVAARAGDPIATSIWRRTVDDLVSATVTAARASSNDSGLISWTGGLFEVTDLVRKPWTERLADVLPDCEVQAPDGAGLDGATLLAQAPTMGPWQQHLWFDGRFPRRMRDSQR